MTANRKKTSLRRIFMGLLALVMVLMLLPMPGAKAVEEVIYDDEHPVKSNPVYDNDFTTFSRATSIQDGYFYLIATSNDNALKDPSDTNLTVTQDSNHIHATLSGSNSNAAKVKAMLFSLA